MCSMCGVGDVGDVTCVACVMWVMWMQVKRKELMESKGATYCVQFAPKHLGLKLVPKYLPRFNV